MKRTRYRKGDYVWFCGWHKKEIAKVVKVKIVDVFIPYPKKVVYFVDLGKDNCLLVAEENCFFTEQEAETERLIRKNKIKHLL